MLFLAVIENPIIRGKLEELYVLYHKQLWYIANGILKDSHEAEDAVQTAFLNVAKYVNNEFNPKCNKSRGLIVIIVRNVSLNQYNKLKRRASVPLDEVVDYLADNTFVSPELYSLRIDNKHQVAKQLAEIKPSYADIIALKYTYEYSNREISDLLKIKEGNVRARLVRAKKALLSTIGGEVIENLS